MRQMILAPTVLLAATQAHAHVSDAHGMAHATEHAWLWLIPALLGIALWPAARRFIRQFTSG